MLKVSLVSLGCPKNLVDSENLIRKLSAEGVAYRHDPVDADIVMVNTCGFIEAAKKESIGEILELGRLKAKDPQKRLVVFGCLAQRYAEELRHEIPEIDALWGVGDDEAILDYCRSMSGIRHGGDTAQAEPRLRLTNAAYAYLKISEGCDRGCSYCVIPSIRGSFRSREPGAILQEAMSLIRSGIKELIIVGQDITEYGRDRESYTLARLVREIAAVEGDFRIRLLYLYPTGISDELIETIRSREKICRYIDMPLQHSEDRILKMMRRGGSRKHSLRLVGRLRAGLTLRTTLIVGFPGETEDEFRNMAAFVSEARFDRLGVFAYSNEEGTPAFSMKGQVPQRTKERRYRELMEIQSRISLEANQRMVGRTVRCLVDEIDGAVAIARLCSQAPEIDGVVFLEGRGVRPGEFVDAEIVDAYDYDLKARVIS